MKDHNAALTRADLPSVETLTRRILRVFDNATPADIEAGAHWYDDAHVLASDLAPHIGSLEAAAEVIAALSPRTFWSRNVAGATMLIMHGEVLPGLMSRNVDWARRIINGEKHVLKGNKTRAFARNIAGDRETVTVDVHAAFVAGVSETVLTRKGVYAAVAHAYRLAARRRGVEPATMQATTWIVGRRVKIRQDRKNRKHTRKG